MNFLSPSYSLLLILMLPLLFFLRKPALAKSKRVPHLAFWLSPEERNIISPPLRKTIFQFRFLFLPVLLFLFLVGALSKPYLGVILTHPLEIIILDNSASMETRENGKTRFEKALGLLKENEANLLMTTDGRMYSKLSSLLQVNWEQKDPIDTLEKALQIGSDKITILTDGAGEGWSRFAQRVSSLKEEKTAQKIHFQIIGTNQDNLGLQLTQIESKGHLFLVKGIIQGESSLNNLLLKYRQGPTRSFLETTREEGVALDLEGKKTWEIYLDPDEGSWFFVELEKKDACLSDNKVLGRLPDVPKVSVLILSEKPQPYLTAALGAYQNLLDIQTSGFSPNPALIKNKKFDLAIVFQKNWDWQYQSLAEKFCFWGTERVFSQRSLGEAQKNIAWKTYPHNLTEGIDFSLLRVDKAQIYSPTTKTLVQGNYCPLLWLDQREEKNYLYLNFFLEESNFFGLPAFPLFIKNLLQWAQAKDKIKSSEIIQFPLSEMNNRPLLTSTEKAKKKEKEPLFFRPGLVIGVLLGLCVLLGRLKQQ